MKKIIKYSTITFVALIILIGTLAIPKTVYNKKDMEAVKLGYPIHFITQDVTKYDPPFPWRYSFESPWESPFKISWFDFILSYLIIFFCVTLTFTEINKLFLKSIKSDIA